MICNRCGKPIRPDVGFGFVGDGDGSGEQFAHMHCYKRKPQGMTVQDWARRFDLSVEYANYQAGQVWEEEAWARSLGFAHAEEYHAATDEAFAESVREDANWEAWG